MEKTARTTLFHITSPDRRDSILATGLNYEGVERNWRGYYEDEVTDDDYMGMGQPRGVYLWDSYKDAVVNWGGGFKDIWSVDATGLHLAPDPALKNLGAWYTRDAIPPDRIKLIRASGDEQYNWSPFPGERSELERRREEREVGAREWDEWNDSRYANILDPIHPKLDQRIFEGETPKSHITRFIKRVYYKAFSNRFGVPVQDVPLYVNLIMTGSLTTYQYSWSSDCDVSAFFDWNKIYQDLDLPPDEARRALIALSIDHIDGTFLPGGIHPIQFFVVKQGLAPTDLYKPGLRSGFDMDAQIWIVPPEKERAHDIATDFPDVYQRASDIADKMSEMLDAGDENRAKDLWKQVHKKRQLDQTAGAGDFCEGNITYKWLVHQGLVDRLRKELGLQIASHVDKHAVEWSGDLDPRLLDSELELGGMAVWDKLEQQVVTLASALGEITWLPRDRVWDSRCICYYDALVIGPLPMEFVFEFPHITGEISYFVALHEIGHATFKSQYVKTFTQLNSSVEEELWAHHFMLENAQIPLGDSTLESMETAWKSHTQGIGAKPDLSRAAPGWVKQQTFEPPQDVLDTFKRIAECPRCGHHMLREEGQELYCPDCGYTFKTASNYDFKDLENQVVALAQKLNTPIYWDGEAFWQYNYAAAMWFADDQRWEIHIRPIADEQTYMSALHELGHVAFHEEHGLPEGDSNSQEEELWAWHYMLEQALIPLSEEALMEARGSFLTYNRRQLRSPHEPNWIHSKLAAKRMKVIYDHEADRITLGSSASTGNKIIGEYDGEGSVTLYEAQKQWINPTYFRRLWNYSYPHRPLAEVHYERAEDRKKLKTVDHPHHERERNVD